MWTAWSPGFNLLSGVPSSFKLILTSPSYLSERYASPVMPGPAIIAFACKGFSSLPVKYEQPTSGMNADTTIAVPTSIRFMNPPWLSDSPKPFGHRLISVHDLSGGYPSTMLKKSASGSCSLCRSERLEMFRKTKILAVIHRAIDHSRLSAREGGVQHWPQFRRSLDPVADRSKALRQSDEIRVAELNTGGPRELHLLFPSDDPVPVVPPDQHDEWKVQPYGIFQFLDVHQKSAIPGYSHDAPRREQELGRNRPGERHPHRCKPVGNDARVRHLAGKHPGHP